MKTGFSDDGQSLTKIPTSAQQGFAELYATTNPPWDIGKPQPPFVAVADQIVGPLLDSGCGTGGTAPFFAERGLAVTGIDFVEEAIRRVRIKAEERGLSVDFLVKDAMTLGEWDRRFASVIDSGLFHIYDGAERRHYIQGLTHVLQPGGRLFLFSFSDKEPSRREGGVSHQALHEAFADGWAIESLELTGGELNPAFAAAHPGAFDGVQMWFAIIRRVA